MADKIINGSLKVTGGLVDSNNNSISVDNIQEKLTAGTGISINGTVISSTLEGVDYEVVNELPLIGEKGIIYLVPNGESGSDNIYDEYMWIVTEESGDIGRFECVGSTQTDLTNYVDLSSAQTVTGTKTFTLPLKFVFGNYTYKFDDANFGQLYFGRDSGNAGIILDGGTLRTKDVVPQSNNTSDIGTTNNKYKDIYATGNLDFSGNVKVSGTSRYNFTAWNILPYSHQDLGSSSYPFKDAYIDGKLKDGTNEIAVSEIAKKSLISDEYDSTKTYAVGDVVIYNNTLYKCITAITVAEDFDSTHWQATTVAELVADETIIKLDTGTYTANTPMSAKDLSFFQPLLDMNTEQALKYLRNKLYFRLDNSRNEVHTTSYFSVRGTMTQYASTWYDIQIIFPIGSTITLTPTRLQNGTY